MSAKRPKTIKLKSPASYEYVSTYMYVKVASKFMAKISLWPNENPNAVIIKVY